VASVDLIRGDRRTDQRYTFEMPMLYLYRRDGSMCLGSGQTMDLSRKGIRFASDDPLPRDTEVELRVEWPFLLQQVCPLELRIWGRVLRSDSEGTVVRTNKYEFRTVGARSFDQVIASAANLSIVA
jgi:hypothetical protein